MIEGNGRVLMPGLIDAHWHCISESPYIGDRDNELVSELLSRLVLLCPSSLHRPPNTLHTICIAVALL